MKKTIPSFILGLACGLTLVSFPAVADNITKDITASYKNIKIVINGEPKQTDKEPFIIDGSTYVPLRFISENLGATINWDDKTNTIAIDSKAYDTPVLSNTSTQNTYKENDTVTYDDGTIYEGETINGQPFGYGKMAFPNGDIFEGNFTLGCASGKGKYTFKSNEAVQEGTYSNGKREGFFKTTSTDGYTTFTEFNNDIAVNKTVTFSNSIVLISDEQDGKAINQKYFIPLSSAASTPTVTTPTTITPVSTTTYNWSTFSQLEGYKIVAQDGTYLGIISTNTFDSKSIANQFGDYGSQFKTNSIFNQFGSYGSQFGTYSPLNSFSSSPPKIYNGDKFIAYLTTNTVKTPRVDTTELMSWIKSKQ